MAPSSRQPRVAAIAPRRASTPLLIRRAKARDLPAMVALLGRLFEQEAEFKPDAARQRRGLRLILAEPSHGCLLVAEHQGAVVGMASLLASISTALGARVAWLEDLVVDPGQRRRGVGRRLLQAAATEARLRGWRRLSLLTDADNAAAQALYQAQGFTASPMRPYRKTVQKN